MKTILGVGCSGTVRHGERAVVVAVAVAVVLIVVVVVAAVVVVVGLFVCLFVVAHCFCLSRSLLMLLFDC